MSTRILLSSTFLMAIALFAQPIQAQRQANDTLLNRTVVVEQQYNPNINNAEKVFVMPDPRDFTASPSEVEYDRNATPATVLPGTTMSAYVGEEKQARANSGFVRAGYGNKGNLDVEGNYLFRTSERDFLNVFGKMQGMNSKVHTSVFANRWKARFYRTTLGADYVHRFDDIDFFASYTFGLANYNHFSYVQPNTNSRRNTTNDLGFGIRSTTDAFELDYTLQAGLKTFNASHNPFYGYTGSNGGHMYETELFVKGDYVGEISTEQKVGIAFDWNYLMYNLDEYKNYNTLMLNPYYTWNDEGWKIRLGANVDLATSFGKKFYISPDVKIEYTPVQGYTLYANATGGRQLNDLRAQEALNPYAVFSLDAPYQLESAYEQLNSFVGFKMNPMEGLSFDIYGGYRNVRNDLYDAFYPVNVSEFPVVFLGVQKTSNYFAGVQLDYAYKNFFKLLVKGQLYNWDTRENNVSLAMKPKSRFDVQMDVRIIAPLVVNVNYEYVKRHDIYGVWLGQFADKNINNLSIGANYDVFKGVDVYARVSNLLDRKFEHYFTAPMPGINFLGGLIFNF